MGADFTCVDCFRTLLRIILVVVNIFIALLGLLIFSVGIWALADSQKIFEISDSHSSPITQVPILLIVVGIFILLLGVVGTVGGIFAGYIGGRIILGLYAFVLALLVICEIAGGIAAAVEKDDITKGFTDSLNSTFYQYGKDKSITDAWNTTQKALKCCGNHNYTDYATIGLSTIPPSCCNTKGDVCDSLDNTTLQYVYKQGCGEKVRDFVSHKLGVVAGVAITFGLMQVIGIVVSCFVAIAGSRAEGGGNYQVV